MSNVDSDLVKTCDEHFIKQNNLQDDALRNCKISNGLDRKKQKRIIVHWCDEVASIQNEDFFPCAALNMAFW